MNKKQQSLVALERERERESRNLKEISASEANASFDTQKELYLAKTKYNSFLCVF